MSDEEKLHDVDVNYDEQPPKPSKYPQFNNTRPWVRFSASSLDVFVFQTLFIIFLVIVAPSFIDELNNTVLFILTLFVWTFVQTLLLCTWGTTPFKWLLRVQIKTEENTKPGLLKSFRRSMKVWFFGWAMGLPFISIFSFIAGFSDLTKRGITRWDKSEHLKVTHGDIGTVRASIAWAVGLGYPGLIILAKLYWLGH